MLGRKVPGMICTLLAGVMLLAGCEKQQESPEAPEAPAEGIKAVEEKAAEVEKVVTEKVEEVKAVAADLKADIAKTLAEIQEQVKSMGVEEIKAMALKYKDAIVSHEGDIVALMEKTKGLGPVDALSEEGKNLQAEIKALSEAIKPLKERYDVYIARLSELGVDLSEFALSK